MSASQLVLDIPPALWMTANRPIANNGHRSRVIRAIHDLTQEQAVEQDFEPTEHPVRVTWTIRYPKGVRTDKGDPTNAHPTCKAILDGLVPDWLIDDGPRYVTFEGYKRGPNLDYRGFHSVQLDLDDERCPHKGRPDDECPCLELP